MIRIAFAHAEQPTARQHLKALGVGLVTFNWYGHQTKFTSIDPAVLSNNLTDFTTIVESGAVKVDAKGWPDHKVKKWAADYEDFIASHWDDIHAYTEFNSVQLGREWLERQRAQKQDDPKFWPVWSMEEPSEWLPEMAGRFENIVVQGALMSPHQNLRDTLLDLSEIHGTKFHAMGTHTVEKVKRLPLSTLATGIWSNPGRNGALIFWDTKTNTIITRPDMESQTMRARVNAAATAAGCDAHAVLDGDWAERTRLAVWSVQMMERNLNGGVQPTLQLVQSSDDSPLENPGVVVEIGDRASAISPPEVRNIVPMPILGFERQQMSEYAEDGTETLTEGTFIKSSPISVRQCNNCAVSSYCPAVKPGAMCSLSIPVEVTTKDQLRSLINALIEMQGQRVAFARFAEELAGGLPDGTTSAEIDRFFRMLKATKQLEEQKQTVRLTVEQQGTGGASPGVLSAIFGDRTVAPLRELAGGPIDSWETNKILQQITEIEDQSSDN